MVVNTWKRLSIIVRNINVTGKWSKSWWPYIWPLGQGYDNITFQTCPVNNHLWMAIIEGKLKQTRNDIYHIFLDTQELRHLWNLTCLYEETLKKKKTKLCSVLPLLWNYEFSRKKKITNKSEHLNNLVRVWSVLVSLQIDLRREKITVTSPCNEHPQRSRMV